MEDIEKMENRMREQDNLKDLSVVPEKRVGQKTVRVCFPEYWAKRKNRLNPELLKKLEDTANSGCVVSDDFGSYKPGTFLYKSAVVTVTQEGDLWGLHIFSENPIGLPLIKEIRYKYLPDNLLMAQLFASRSDEKTLRGVVLYQIPNNQVSEEGGE